jgi:hypothetical protein
VLGHAHATAGWSPIASLVATTENGLKLAKLSRLKTAG